MGIGLLLFSLLGCSAFDDLVQREHDHHPLDWDRDGRPNGIIWRAEDQTWSLSSNILGSWYSLAWFIRAPKWVSGDDEAIRLLRKLRKLALYSLAWLLLCIATAILIIPV
jgi:hypothetical protein